MTDDKPTRPRAAIPRGFRDVFAAEAEARRAMLDVIRGVYHGYGFEALDTSAIEYVEALGKFLPDVDRPMGGVFGFQDDDEQWLALRYDLTAPLARVVAGNYDKLPKPYRRYAVGPVWRNEKPGPGRYREFTQFDADTVGTPVMAADAEITMLLADAMEGLGIARGDYIVRVNDRKVLTGVLEVIGLGGDDPAIVERRMTVLRAIDKLDRLGVDGVSLLLGPGRRDESGDFTRGAGLSPDQIAIVTGFVAAGEGDAAAICARLRDLVSGSETGVAGVLELEQIAELVAAGGYGADRIVIDPSVVRGLAYYTGPVFEAELTFETVNEKGEPARFGSVAGGGRYDDLVKRFTGKEVPATGVSIGVDRLLTALRFLGKTAEDAAAGPVVVLVLDRDRMGDYQAMTQDLRRAGVRAEMYLGGSGMRAQMKYADKRRAPAVVIQGSDEHAKGEVTVKDLVLGAQMAQEIDSNEEWREGRPAQATVDRGDLVATVRAILDRGPAR